MTTGTAIRKGAGELGGMGEGEMGNALPLSLSEVAVVPRARG
jgi:hypothetical protein